MEQKQYENENTKEAEEMYILKSNVCQNRYCVHQQNININK